MQRKNRFGVYYCKTMTKIPETSVAIQSIIIIQIAFVPTHEVGFNSSKQEAR